MRTIVPCTLIALCLAGAAQASGQDYAPGDSLEARVWMDRGDEPLLQRGDRVRLYYRTSADAYVTIFHIDTDGAVQLLFPRSPDDDDLVRGGQDYRLLFPTTPYWYVDEDPGQGYFFILGSPEPFDYGAFAYSPYDRTWDLSAVGLTVYQDPYLAMDDYVTTLLPGWEEIPYALDFVSYDVGETHDYPRFLCYDCHGFQSYASWNPYTYACASFRVVVWDDPYFYPRYRYARNRVVYASPRRGIPRYELTRRAPGEGWSTVWRTRQPPVRRVQYAEPSVVRPSRDYVPPRRRIVPSDAVRRGGREPAGTGRVVTPSTSTLRPPSSPQTAGTAATGARTAPGTTTGGSRVLRAPTDRRGTLVAPSRERPVLQRRPTSTRGTTRPSVSVGSPRGSSARPSTNGARVVRPPARSGSSRPAPSRPSARPSTGARPTGSRPAARPPARRPSGPSARPARSKPKGKSGGL
jgi:hypothetical protein